MKERVERKQIESYRVYLKERSRPPSRGGNTSALHAHVIKIEGVDYSFLALGPQRWVHKTDLVSFEYETKGDYRNILKETLKTVDRRGNEIIRGNRGFKARLRTAPAREPASRRERRS
jgi:hypothetical protein